MRGAVVRGPWCALVVLIMGLVAPPAASSWCGIWEAHAAQPQKVWPPGRYYGCGGYIEVPGTHVDDEPMMLIYGGRNDAHELPAGGMFWPSLNTTYVYRFEYDEWQRWDEFPGQGTSQFYGLACASTVQAIWFYGGMLRGSENANASNAVVKYCWPGWPDYDGDFWPIDSTGPNRFYHTSVIKNKVIYTFGGSEGLSSQTAESMCLNTFLSFDGNNGGAGWVDITPTNGPAGRSKHSAVLVGDDTMVLFGGVCEPESTLFGDTWLYSISSNSWMCVSNCNNNNAGGAAAKSSPSPRFAAAMAVTSSEHVVLYGGIDSSGTVLSDTWVLDMSSEIPVWSELTNSGTTNPPALFGAAMARNNETDTVFVFSGCQSMDPNDSTLCTSSDPSLFSLSLVPC
ncbi:hypothetical protein Pelo_18494 [Pelomyxa schiedti]|nr:hypothetical protein Pelo_18494 [Pelomyxa schiedti]